MIETSGRIGLVGVALGDCLLAERSLDESRRHARDLVPTLAELLREQDWRARELNAVFVSLGPGSYTGLRVGVMSAKTLAFATGCAIIGVPTFEVLARQAECSQLQLAVVADAQKDQLYSQRFRRDSVGGTFRADDDMAVVSAHQWAVGLSPGVAVSGPGIAKAAPWLPAGAVVIAPPARSPTVSGLLAVGLDRYERGVREDLFRLQPLYFRPSSAEEQWDRRPG